MLKHFRKLTDSEIANAHSIRVVAANCIPITDPEMQTFEVHARALTKQERSRKPYPAVNGILLILDSLDDLPAVRLRIAVACSSAER